MDIYFQDPTAIPLPPAEVRIKDLRAAAWEDNRRVGVYLELTPFQKRPNAELSITNPSGKIVAQASIVETMILKMELTLHLRGPTTGGAYILSVSIFYLQADQSEADDPENFTDPSRRQVVDTAQAIFELHQTPDQSHPGV
jgi:hypothetical protein